jgi:putative endonuclease
MIDILLRFKYMVKIFGVGKFGEDVAELFLKKKKYRILSRNYILGRVGEIDIVAREKSGKLVFVEVKTLVEFDGTFSPEDHFNEEKIFRVRRLAEAFANKHPEYIDVKLGYRIDLVAVSMKSIFSKLSNWENECDVRHYENF